MQLSWTVAGRELESPGYWQKRYRPVEPAGTTEVSLFSCMLFRGVPGVYNYGRFGPASHCGRADFAFPLGSQGRHLQLDSRSSIPGPPAPLSMLRMPARAGRRKTRSQDGSLLLSCRALSSPTTCRFIPALDPFRPMLYRYCVRTAGMEPAPRPHIPLAPSIVHKHGSGSQLPDLPTICQERRSRPRP